MKFLVVCGLVAYCVLSSTAALSDERKGFGDGVVGGNQAHQQAKLFGGYTTRTRISTLTSTILYSCVSTLGVATVCTGKRRKRASGLAILQPTDVEVEELSSSHDIEERSAVDTKGKLFIALTSFTTLTTTEFAVNAATTVSISYSCVPLGDTVAPICG